MYKVRIKENAKIFQDFMFDRWPNCLPPLSEYKNEKWRPITKYPDAVFMQLKKNIIGIVGEMDMEKIMITVMVVFLFILIQKIA